MSVRALIAAAAVAMGIGQAQAASVRHDLRYVDTVLDEALVFDSETGDILWQLGPLSVHDAPWDLSAFHTGMQKGDPAEAYIEYEIYLDFEDSGYGYIAPVCWVGNFDCTVLRGERAVLPDFHVATDAFVVSRDETTFHATTWGSYYGEGFHFSGNGYRGYAESITTTFVIVEPAPVELAPVPLPASAALLPLGIGALAMMRRRRRSA